MHAENITFAILDWQFAGEKFSGVDLARHLLLKNPTTKLMIVTAQSSSSPAFTALQKQAEEIPHILSADQNWQGIAKQILAEIAK